MTFFDPVRGNPSNPISPINPIVNQRAFGKRFFHSQTRWNGSMSLTLRVGFLFLFERSESGDRKVVHTGVSLRGIWFAAQKCREFKIISINLGRATYVCFALHLLEATWHAFVFYAVQGFFEWLVRWIPEHLRQLKRRFREFMGFLRSFSGF